MMHDMNLSSFFSMLLRLHTPDELLKTEGKGNGGPHCEGA